MLNLSEIGLRLKKIRGSITQKALAEEYGVKRSYVANIETGRTQPSIEYLLFNSQKFNVSMDWILSGEEVLKASLKEDDPVLRGMVAYLRLIWKTNDQEMQSWLKIQFSKCFPNYLEELKKSESI